MRGNMDDKSVALTLNEVFDKKNSMSFAGKSSINFIDKGKCNAISDNEKLIALQDALRDPVTNHEGF